MFYEGLHQGISGLLFLISLYNNKCCLIYSICLIVSHCTVFAVVMPLLKFWGVTIICFREIMFSVDPILRSSEMSVVRFMCVSPLECKEFVAASHLHE